MFKLIHGSCHSHHLPPSSPATVTANGEVYSNELRKGENHEELLKKSEYAKYSPAVKFKLVKYAAQHGMIATFTHNCIPKCIDIRDISEP